MEKVNEIREKQQCGNCKYFLQYYVKRTTVFRPVYWGVCRRQITLKRIERDYDHTCEFWESDRDDKTEREKTIKQTLKTMAHHVNHMAAILDDDKNENICT